MTQNKSLAVLMLLVFTAGLLYLGITQKERGFAPADPQNSQEIQAVIQRAYAVVLEGLRNGGDVSQFPEVLTNTSDFSYSNKEARDFVELVMGAEAARTGGYLTSMQAKIIANGCAIRKFQEVDQVAKGENREVTTAEYKEIQKDCFGSIPGSLGEGNPRTFVFEKIEIKGDRARVRFDDGAALQEAILVRKDGRWLIANITPINVHY